MHTIQITQARDFKLGIYLETVAAWLTNWLTDSVFIFDLTSNLYVVRMALFKCEIHQQISSNLQLNQHFLEEKRYWF